MLKNNKGVTLTILVITIIVIIILAGTVITASNLIITSTKAKTVVTNMYLVQSKAEALNEEYEFNNIDTSNYIGKPISDLNSYGIAVNAGDKWFVWDETTLVNLGFDNNMLSNGGEFIVNYKTGEVIYTKGVKDNDGVVKYTLTDLIK